MKKFIALFLIAISFCLTGLTNVIAAESSGTVVGERILLIFVEADDDEGGVTANIETGAENTAYFIRQPIGSTIAFDARSCLITNEMVVDGGSDYIYLKVPRSSCEPIEATYSITAQSQSDPTALEMNGNVGTVRQYDADLKITASAPGYDSVTRFIYVREPYADNDNNTNDNNTNNNTPSTDQTPEPSIDQTPEPSNTTTNWKYLFVIDEGTEEVVYSTDNSKKTKIEKTIKVGESVKFKAIICSDKKATNTNDVLSWKVSDCVPATKVNWTKDSSSGGAFEIDQNGKVTGKKTGFGFGWVYAKVDKEDVSLEENEYFMDSHNSVVIKVVDAIYNGNKGTKKNNVKIGNTASNTSVLIIIVGVAMLGFGGYLIYTSQSMNKNLKKN